MNTTHSIYVWIKRKFYRLPRWLRRMIRISNFVILPGVIVEYLTFLDRGYFAIGGEAIFPLLGAFWLLWPYLYFIEQNWDSPRRAEIEP